MTPTYPKNYNAQVIELIVGLTKKNLTKHVIEGKIMQLFDVSQPTANKWVRKAKMIESEMKNGSTYEVADKYVSSKMWLERKLKWLHTN